jgi:hypothetical protein
MNWWIHTLAPLFCLDKVPSISIKKQKKKKSCLIKKITLSGLSDGQPRIQLQIFQEVLTTSIFQEQARALLVFYIKVENVLVQEIIRLGLCRMKLLGYPLHTHASDAHGYMIPRAGLHSPATFQRSNSA